MSGADSSTTNAWGTRPSSLPAAAPVDRGSGGANHGSAAGTSGGTGGNGGTRRSGSGRPGGFFMPKWARDGGTFSPGRAPAPASAAPASSASGESGSSSSNAVSGLGGLTFSGLASPIGGNGFGLGPPSGGSALSFLRGGSGPEDLGGSRASSGAVADAPVPASRGGVAVESLGSSLAELRGLRSPEPSAGGNGGSVGGNGASSASDAGGSAGGARFGSGDVREGGPSGGGGSATGPAGRFWGQRRGVDHPPVSHPPRRKVTRYTKDELLALQKPSELPGTMPLVQHVTTMDSLSPCVRTPFNPAEIYRHWTSRGRSAGRGAGRGRGRDVDDGAPRYRDDARGGGDDWRGARLRRGDGEPRAFARGRGRGRRFGEPGGAPFAARDTTFGARGRGSGGRDRDRDAFASFGGSTNHKHNSARDDETFGDLAGPANTVRSWLHRCARLLPSGVSTDLAAVLAPPLRAASCVMVPSTEGLVEHADQPDQRF